MDIARGDQADSLVRNFTHVAESYDELPYDDRPIFRTHPGRLAASARLFGLKPVPLEHARVLELGCAAGANIIPLAVFYPDARFLGIDLGRVQIEDGQRRIAAMGIGNIELRCESITDFPRDAGEFDYIICHGVYSWVPAPVREAILALCSRHLSPDGIAYISYNVLPGWRVLQPLRDALRALLPREASIPDRARLGRRLVTYLAEMTPDKSSYGAALRQLPEQVADSSDAYLYHEFMEEVNDAFLFSEFVADAGRHDLAYLCETELSPMFAERYGEEFAGKLAQSTRDDVISHEQMLDILSGNTFRTTLLVPGAKLPEIDRAISMHRLAELHFVPSYLYSCRREADIVSIVNRAGQSFDYDDPVVQRLIERLFGGILRSHTFEDLLAGFADQDLEDVTEALVAMVMGGMVILNDTALPIGGAGEYPCANAVARADAAMGRHTTATRMHVSVEVDEFGRYLLPRLDGTRSVSEIAASVAADLDSGAIELSAPDGVVPGDQTAIARAMVDAALANLAAHGLLEG